MIYKINDSGKEKIFLKKKKQEFEISTGNFTKIEFYEGLVFNHEYKKSEKVVQSTELQKLEITSLNNLCEVMTNLLNIPSTLYNSNSRIAFEYRNDKFEIIEVQFQNTFHIENKTKNRIKIGLLYFDEITSFIQFEIK